MSESIITFLHATAPHLATQLTEERLALMRQITEITSQRAELLEALKAIRDHTFVDAEGPELRAQNECNHRRACAVIVKIEES